MTGPSVSRFSRLLAMVPYLAARQGITVAQAAADLGISQAQLTRDIEQLFVCGQRSNGFEDLIDVQYDSGYVRVEFTAGMDRPLRLTGAEAALLQTALATLADIPGVDADAIRRAIAKIETALAQPMRVGKKKGLRARGEELAAAEAAARGGTDSDEPSEGAGGPRGREAHYDRVRAAARDGRALRLRYYTPGRDATGDRVVDPISVGLIDGSAYLQAWCRQAEGIRLFRFDRIEAAQQLDEPAAPPPAAAEAGPPAGWEAQDLPTAGLEIDPESLWAVENYLVDLVDDPAEPATGPARAVVRYGSPEWLTRFVLGFGGTIRLTDSPEIARDVAQRAADARARYR